MLINWLRRLSVRARGVIALIAILAIVFTAAGKVTTNPSASRQVKPAAPVGVADNQSKGQHASTPKPVKLANGMLMLTSQAHLSPKLSSLKPSNKGLDKNVELNEENEDGLPLAAARTGKDPVVQTSFVPGSNSTQSAQKMMPGVIRNFPGIDYNSGGSGVPPDTNGEAGPSNYMQIVNSSLMIYDKSGNPLLSFPVNIYDLWSGENPSTPCSRDNDGDPVVLYDQLANRWLISQFNFDFNASSEPVGPYYECIAVSQTGDPLGSYWAYSFPMSNTSFPDYPKIGVWPDGYYMSTNQFDNAQTYAGPEATVFERSKMLSGQTARLIIMGSLGSSHNPMLPSDLDGNTLPSSGAPNYFIEDGSPMGLYKFHTDWTTPANSTFTGPTAINVAPFNYLCPANGTSDCIPQKGTSQKLDSLGDRLMFRLAYRKFSDHESLVVSRSVDAGSNRAGIRWYEIRNPGSTLSVYQQGTYAPADGNSRWMPSIAMDKKGDMAIGYSISSSTMYPSIRYTGRLATDARNTMPQGEGNILNGTGYQSYPGGLSRWGDYSDMAVDPTDDCTFWYTTEVNPSDSYQWTTQIASFKFPQCTDSTAPTVSVPSQSFVSNSTIPSTSKTSTVPVNISWSGSDSSGIAAYQLQQKTDSSTFTSVTLSPATRTSIVRNLAPGHTYQFRVRAEDKASNWSAYKTGVSFRVAPYQETATTADSTGTKITYSTGWTQQSLSTAYGGGVRYASTANKTVTFTMNGRAVAWVAPKSSSRGQAKVYVDGTLVTTTNLNSSTSQSRVVVYSKTWSSVGTHTVKLVLAGTSGHPRVDVDAFVVLR